MPQRPRRLGRSFVTLACLAGLAACGGAPGGDAKPTTARAATPRKGEFVELSEASARTLPSGAKLTVPARWWLAEVDGGLAFQDPDREISITLLEIGAPSTDEAMKLALAKLGRTAPAKVLRAVHENDVAGWDEVGETVWETPPSEQSVFAMNVRRRGDKVWAALLEGKSAAFARRGAQVAEIVLGLQVPGVAEEDLSPKTPARLEGARLAAFDAFVSTAREKTHVPGVAVAVVQDGAIVFEKGYGVRERGKNDPVTERTRFMIGSVTKSLSTLLVAKLVDEKKLSWDTKVTELLPTFKTGDDELTKKLTIANTFCACTGMPRRDLDLIFEYANKKPEDAFGAYADVKPTTPMGETFQYANQMTAIGGFLAARVAEPGKPLGTAYAAAMKKHVFDVMGMTDTTASYEEGRKATAGGGGVASPHAQSFVGTRDEPMVVPMAMEGFVAPVAPAGSVFSTAHDMARYAQVELANGKTPEGKEAFAEATLLERRKTRVRVGPKGGYGLGLATSSYRGLPVVTHDGGTFGFVSRFLLVPDKRIGLVILTNGAHAGATFVDAVTQRLVEVLFDAKEIAARDLDRAINEDMEEWQRQHERVASPVPDALVTRITGTWRHPTLGTFTVTAPKGDRPKLDVGEWSSRLGYEKSDDGTERLFFVDPPIGGLPLTVEKDALVLVLGQETYRLTKK